MAIVILLALILHGITAEKPNFVLILTDDQDILLNGMLPMTKTEELIANQGLTFTNAYANTPICCPSRSSLLTGLYPKNTMVFNNSLSGNCSTKDWQLNLEPKSIANMLKTKGKYTNFYAGKYLNQYGSKQSGGVGHIPPGYDWWLALKGNSKYFNYTLSVNGTAHHFGNVYLTDLLAKYAVQFINEQSSSSPFFMTLAVPASHAPFTPANRHSGKFAKEECVKTPSFNKTPVAKHWLLRNPPTLLPSHAPILNEIQRKRLETLLAVDELVQNVVQTLEDKNQLDNTYIIYTSDNGYHIGQFAQAWDKRQPYQTDIRVPLLIRGPKIPRKTTASTPVALVDLFATILDLAGLNATSDGRSLVPVLVDPGNAHSNGRVFIDYQGEANLQSVDEKCFPNVSDRRNLAQCSLNSWCKCQDARNNTYKCVLDFRDGEKWKFCQFYDDLMFTEAYNLAKDPYELRNLCSDLPQEMLRYFRSILIDF